MTNHQTQELAEQTVVIEKRDGIAIIHLNAPHNRNSLGLAMIGALEQALEDVNATELVHAVVLAGRAGYFSSGADLQMLADLLDDSYKLFQIHDRLVGLTNTISQLRVPVIAAINGPALGGGVELSLACDIRIMEESAYFSFPEVKLGIMPGAGGTARLPRLIGKEKAMYYELTGDAITAAEAANIGLVLRTVQDGEALSQATTIAVSIANSAPAAVEFIKRAMRVSLDMPIDAAVDHCQAMTLLLSGTSEAKNNITAFLQRRGSNRAHRAPQQERA